MDPEGGQETTREGGHADARRRDWEARREARRRARKERVLHTRISEDLADDIRRLAEDLRVPVSNLVRNVLEEAFSVVETVTDNVGDLIEDVVDEAESARERVRRRHRHRHRRHRPGREPRAAEAPRFASERAEFPEVLGWQPLVLNQGQSCADCEEPQERGERAFLGITAQGPSAIYLCGDCMDARR